jgi:transcriptional/translational regulatory protein YebC/TACO1
MKKAIEVLTDYTCDQNLTHIDAYFSHDDEDAGKTVAFVCRDTKKVIYKDNDYRSDKAVSEAIKTVLKEIEEQKIVLIVSGGVLSSVMTNTKPSVNPNVYLVDYDIDCSEGHDLIDVPQGNGKTEKAVGCEIVDWFEDKDDVNQIVNLIENR